MTPGSDKKSIRTTSPGAVGVMVVDDQAAFRRVARAVIDATDGFEPVGDAASGSEALACADELRPDLVLMDVHMPGIDGFEATRRLTTAHPETIVVLISLEEFDAFPGAVASCGAAAFLRKQNLGTRVLRSLWSTHHPGGTTACVDAVGGTDG